MKICPKCKQAKSAEEFSRRGKNSDKLSSWCRECANERERDDREKNTEYYKAYEQLRYAKKKGGLGGHDLADFKFIRRNGKRSLWVVNGEVKAVKSGEISDPLPEDKWFIPKNMQQP